MIFRQIVFKNEVTVFAFFLLLISLNFTLAADIYPSTVRIPSIEILSVPRSVYILNVKAFVCALSCNRADVSELLIFLLVIAPVCELELLFIVQHILIRIHLMSRRI